MAKPLQMPDNRILAVSSFLDGYRCGSQIDDFDVATDFVNDADTNGIDYRILPSIWILESTCGKQQEVNNGFGFMKKGGGLMPFGSTEDAIAYISSAWTRSPYAGKTLKGAVQTYNPPSANPNYYSEFMQEYGMISANEASYERLIPELQNNQIDSE